MKLRSRLFVVFILLFFGNIAVQAELAERIAEILSEQKNVDFSIYIIHAETETVVYQHNAHQPMIPASNMKVITSSAALKYLGPDFQYNTKVGISGDTLIVIAAGDPLFGDRKLDSQYGRDNNWILKTIVNKLKENKITSINNIIIDTTIFDNQLVHPSWPPGEYNRDYSCEVCGLNYKNNCIKITVANFNNRITIDIEPQTCYIDIINQVQPISSGTGSIEALRNPTPNKVTVRGKCKNRQGPIEYAIEKPAPFFGFLLAEQMLRSEIQAQGQIIEKAFTIDSNFKLLVEFKTPFSDALKRVNTDSLNFAAEALLKTTAAHSNPDKKNGSWKKGRDVISQYLIGLGINPAEFYIDDGSGLSRKNKLSSFAIATVLIDRYKDDTWPMYAESLAKGGEDSYITKPFDTPRYRDRVFGKTGYITGVKSFSGYCKTDNGDYIFSIISNQTDGDSRDAINDIVKAIIETYSL